MLYLAEVKREKRVLGSSKAELKLLACQRSENSWSAVQGEESVPAPDDANYMAGILVMVELSGNRQVQRHSEAGMQLVKILQNFSRFQEKSKTQEDEIEQWKQSLTYQSQELNRRELEMEARQEQLQQMEEDFERLEQQRQEIETDRQDVDRLRSEFERKSQELEGAWAQLQGQMSQLKEQQVQFNQISQASVLDDAKAQEIQELLNRLSGAIAPTEAVREQLNLSFDLLSQRQHVIEQHGQHLEQQRTSAQQTQTDLDQRVQAFETRWQEWQQAQTHLENLKCELSARQKALELKQEYAQALVTQLQKQDSLHQQFCYLAETSDRVKIGAKVDREALEKMSLEELETVVRDLGGDLEKVSRFVNSQEEELTLQQDTINEVSQQIQGASEYDRLRIESELADEQDRYKMLNETLVGQRRNLQERRDVLKQHQIVLTKRRGNTAGNEQGQDIDIAPVLNQLDVLRQELAEAIRQAQSQVQVLQQGLDQTQGAVDQQRGEQESRWQEVKRWERELLEQKASTGELWGRVNAYQESLQLMQESASGLREKLDAIAQMMAQFQEASDFQLQAIAEMRQTIMSLSENRTPEFVA